MVRRLSILSCVALSFAVVTSNVHGILVLDDFNSPTPFLATASALNGGTATTPDGPSDALGPRVLSAAMSAPVGTNLATTNIGVIPGQAGATAEYSTPDAAAATMSITYPFATADLSAFPSFELSVATLTLPVGAAPNFSLSFNGVAALGTLSPGSVSWQQSNFAAVDFSAITTAAITTSLAPAAAIGPTVLNVQFETLTAVPEPAVIGLLAGFSMLSMMIGHNLWQRMSNKSDA